MNVNWVRVRAIEKAWLAAQAAPNAARDLWRAVISGDAQMDVNFQYRVSFDRRFAVPQGLSYWQMRAHDLGQDITLTDDDITAVLLKDEPQFRDWYILLDPAKVTPLFHRGLDLGPSEKWRTPRWHATVIEKPEAFPFDPHNPPRFDHTNRRAYLDDVVIAREVWPGPVEPWDLRDHLVKTGGGHCYAREFENAYLTPVRRVSAHYTSPLWSAVYDNQVETEKWLKVARKTVESLQAAIADRQNPNRVSRKSRSRATTTSSSSTQPSQAT